MFDNIVVKIVATIILPLIIGWSVWMTKNVFNYKTTVDNISIMYDYFNHYKQDINNRFDKFDGKFDKLNEKIDENYRNNNNILLDLQRQISNNIHK